MYVLYAQWVLHDSIFRYDHQRLTVATGILDSVYVSWRLVSLVEGEGPKGNANAAKRQACYDGALGARAKDSLRTYGDAALDDNAYIITSTYRREGFRRWTLHALRNAPYPRMSLRGTDRIN